MSNIIYSDAEFEAKRISRIIRSSNDKVICVPLEGYKSSFGTIKHYFLTVATILIKMNEVKVDITNGITYKVETLVKNVQYDEQTENITVILN